MKQRTAIAILIAAILGAGAVGTLLMLRNEPQPVAQESTIPPLPPGTRSFGSWALACGQGDQGRCGLLIRLINQDAQRVLMSVNVTRGPQGNAIIAINTPPGVVIPAGVTITPENGTAATGPVQVCRPAGCTGIIVLNEELRMELTSAQMATIGYTTANGQPVSINIPINGFSEGYAAWETAFPAPPPEESEGEDVPAEAPPG
jgi:invasion protein IalB